MPRRTWSLSMSASSIWLQPRAGTSRSDSRRSGCGSAGVSDGSCPLVGCPVDLEAGTSEEVDADVVLISDRRNPRVMDSAMPDGERILTWQQLYALSEVPERLIVVGSGVTGAELADAYLGLGARSFWFPRVSGSCPGRTPTRPR